MATLEFRTPQQNQGQIVEISYATTPRGNVICCWHDKSDGETCFYWARSKKPLTPSQLERYELTPAEARK